MRSMNILHAYRLPESRRDEPKVVEGLDLVVSSCEGQYIQLEVDGAKAVITGQQLTKGAKNASNTVRGCMAVQCQLDTFESAPVDYAAQQKMVQSPAGRVAVFSTELSQFVKVYLPGREDPVTVKVDEILAAVENATRS